MGVTARNIEVTAHATLTTEECCRCGILFAMPADYRQTLVNHPGRTFFCPAGHPQHYTGKTDAQRERERGDRLERDLAAARARATAAEDQAQASERSRRALRAAHTRTKRRVAAGVCPCCNRTFADLAGHMTGQHPDYATAGDQ